MNVDINHSLDGDCFIAPLLMIPFVENCFKHGASKMIDKVYINISIETGNEWLEFTISNSQPSIRENENGRKKIGLLNVQKRLQLLYPAKHQLDIESFSELFKVYMKIKLERQPAVSKPKEQKFSLEKIK